MSNAQTHFEQAITDGILSSDPVAGNYAGKYMYMGSRDGKALFKHSLTRIYL